MAWPYWSYCSRFFGSLKIEKALPIAIAQKSKHSRDVENKERKSAWSITFESLCRTRCFAFVRMKLGRAERWIPHRLGSMDTYLQSQFPVGLLQISFRCGFAHAENVVQVLARFNSNMTTECTVFYLSSALTFAPPRPLRTCSHSTKWHCCSLLFFVLHLTRFHCWSLVRGSTRTTLRSIHGSCDVSYWMQTMSNEN